jgi:hypothetical protein
MADLAKLLEADPFALYSDRAEGELAAALAKLNATRIRLAPELSAFSEASAQVARACRP